MRPAWLYGSVVRREVHAYARRQTGGWARMFQ